MDARGSRSGGGYGRGWRRRINRSGTGWLGKALRSRDGYRRIFGRWRFLLMLCGLEQTIDRRSEQKYAHENRRQLDPPE
jgi:hypothetical protein